MSEFSKELNESMVFQEEQEQCVPKLVGSVQSGVRQLSKGQDFVLDGKTDTYFWKVVCDGHGTNDFIDILRKLDWNIIMSTDDSFSKLLECVRFKTYHVFSGSMLIMVKIYSNRVETLSVGDSRVLIYKNGSLVYKNTPHNRKNLREIARLDGRKIEIRKTKNPIPHIVSSTNLRGFYGEYIMFENETDIASTQSLGHYDITGYEPETHIEKIEEGEHVRVISCSDGFSDMMLIDEDLCENMEDVENDRLDMVNLSVDELLDKAETRWKKKWDYYWNPKNKDLFIETAFPEGGYDDIALSIYDNIEGLVVEP
jgi:serine/threonine protein phosphatase PrpC